MAWNIANFRSGLIKDLIEHGHEVVCAAPPDEHVIAIENLGATFISIPMDNKGTSPIRDLLLLCRYLKLMFNVKPDAYLGFTAKPNIYGSIAASLLRIPTINNISGLGTAYIKNNWLTKLVSTLYRIALRNSCKVFFQNNDDRSLFLKYALVKAHQTALLPGSGVDLTHFQFTPRVREPNEPIVYLLIARLLADKGVREFVAAAKAMKTNKSNASFQLLGFLDAENRTAIKRTEVEEWINDGTIDYLGETIDVRPYIINADCVVLPSYREGTPRTLLEAAAIGRPLIATNVPGCREPIEEGRNGFLCKVMDAKDLERCMLTLQDLSECARKRMGHESRKIAESRYDEKIVKSIYLQALSEIRIKNRS